jgi:sec-independent protein translocase protein TatC
MRQRPIGHEDRLTLVEHLGELRTRIVVSVFAFVAALILCFWQNKLLLDLMNEPLGNRDPITLSPVEPFTTTLTVAAYAAILISLPIILFQLYSFILPAFSPTEKKVALPLLLMVPFLFVGGAVFAYIVVVPAALEFLLNFNKDQFQTEIRARDYYSFVLLTMISAGVLFQIPVGMLGLTKLGIVTPKKLRKNRRYALLGIAVAAAALPGVDPITMLIEMVPLILLYELSILLSAVFGRPTAEAADRLASAEGS